MIENLIVWNNFFRKYPDLIFHGRSSNDIEKAVNEGRTAIIFGFGKLIFSPSCPTFLPDHFRCISRVTGNMMV